MPRTSIFCFYLLLLCASMLSHTRAEFQQITWLPKSSDFNGVHDIFSVGAGKFAFVYDGGVYVADGTPNGTVMVVPHVSGDRIFWNSASSSRVYYMNGPDFKSYNVDSSSEVGHWSEDPYYGSIVGSVDSFLNNFILIMWRTPGCYKVKQYMVNTGSFYWDENCIPDAPDPTPLEFCNMYSYTYYRTSLYPPGVPSDYDSKPSGLFPLSSYCYFNYEQPCSGTGHELWRAYGRSTTHNAWGVEYNFMADLNPGPGSSFPRFFCSAAGGLFFFATPTDDQSLHSLYFMSGDNAVRVRDFNMNPSTKVPIVSIGGRALFIVAECNGTSLWSSDGSSAGTFRLMEVTDTQLVGTPGWAYFVTKTPEYGIELYQTDGTSDPLGTFRVPFETIAGPGSSSPFGLTPMGNDLYFNAYTNGGRTIELFKYPATFTISSFAVDIVFDRKTGWPENGVEVTWGSGGSCGTEVQPAPLNFPVDSNSTVDGLIDSLVYHVSSTSNNYGCGQSYSAPYLNFRRIPGRNPFKQLRFWFKSTVATKLELQVAGPCSPYTVVKGQDPCRLYRNVASTGGKWKSMNLVFGDRPQSEFGSVVSPLLITLKAPGEATVAGVMVAMY